MRSSIGGYQAPPRAVRRVPVRPVEDREHEVVPRHLLRGVEGGQEIAKADFPRVRRKGTVTQQHSQGACVCKSV
jgi:hypothetical protein